MMKKKLILSVIALLSVAPLAAFAQIATSQNFTLEKAVVGSGGGASASTTFSVDGTAGQAVGGQTTSASFQLQSGFWSANNLAPTAAGVSLAGRVSTADGRGLRNAVVYLTDSSGATRTTRTGSFGFYSFEGIAAGQTVTIVVSAKLYEFAPRVLSVSENLSNVDFTALGEGGKN